MKFAITDYETFKKLMNRDAEIIEQNDDFMLVVDKDSVKEFKMLGEHD